MSAHIAIEFPRHTNLCRIKTLCILIEPRTGREKCKFAGPTKFLRLGDMGIRGPLEDQKVIPVDPIDIIAQISSGGPRRPQLPTFALAYWLGAIART